MNREAVLKRNTSLDIIRTVAVFFVVSVHFFYNNGFYTNIVKGEKMYIMVLMRTLFMACVPLFMLLTGYLMCKKTLCRKYYSGIIKTIITYVLATICCIVFKIVFLKKYEFELKIVIFDLLDFGKDKYSWYIEMYIGLFLLIPFLNIIYNNLKTQKHKQILIITMVVLTVLPTLFNIFRFDDIEWWAKPTTSFVYDKLIPAYWTGLYPLTYYFLGAYFREYGIKLSFFKSGILLILSVILFGTFIFYRNYEVQFIWDSYADYYGFTVFIIALLLFNMLSKINTEKWPFFIKLIFMKISDLALGIYLVSWIFDNRFYPILEQKVPEMADRLPYYFIIVPLVFVCSMALSFVLSIIEKLIMLIYSKTASLIN